MPKTGVSVKLLVDKQSNRVLFAEGGKDFVDFLFHFFSLPLGAVVRLLSKEAMVGCLGNLYASIESLTDDYMQPKLQKDILLKPCPTSSCLGESLLLHNVAARASSSASTKFYRCGNSSYSACRDYVSDGTGAICRTCNCQMSREMIYVSPPEKAEVVAPINAGYVKGLVMYMIMDDLVVKPMSTISSITLLNKFNVKDVTTLDEKIAHLGLNEGLALLKASLETKNVLTKVFLGKETT